MTFLRAILVVCPAACLLAQTPAPTAAPKPPAAKPVQKKAAPAAKPAATVKAPPAAATPGDPLAGVPSGQVVLTVGEEKVTAGQFLQILAALPEQSRAQASAGPGRKQFVENLIRVKLLAQEGRRRKIDQTPKFQTQIALQRDEFLASTTFGALQESAAVTDDVVARYYREHKNEFETVRASHILIRFKGSPAPMKPGQKDLTEEQALEKANAIVKELGGGGDFAAIARRDSDDGGSAAYGGDLGAFGRGRMVPSFEEAAFTLPIGTVSAPVKTSFGYHVIKVTQRDNKTLEQAKTEIEKKLRPEAAMKAMESLRKTTNVVIAPQLSGDPHPVPAAKPAAAAK